MTASEVLSNTTDEQCLFEFLCECGSSDGEAGGCEERVSMTINEYDQVRSQDDRFAVAPGHETAAIESVVTRTERFVIVDKRPAPSASSQMIHAELPLPKGNPVFRPGFR